MSNVRLTTLLFFVKQAARDRFGNPVVHIVETKSIGFIYIHLN